MDISTASPSSDLKSGKAFAVIVKVSGGSTFSVQVPSVLTTIGDIKILAESGSKISRHSQRMFYKGKILSDSDTLEDIPASATLFLVKTANTSVAPGSSVGSCAECLDVNTGPPVACLGNCGFYGAPNLGGYCSKCHKAKKIRQEAEIEEAKNLVEKQKEEGQKEITMEDREDQVEKNKCWTCTRKIGLTGVRCRCGYFFCPTHRYAESHNCDYDYKANERRKLTKQNPVVQANKLSEKA